MQTRYPTINNMGWAIAPDDYYNKEFINYAIEVIPNRVLELGAAYGLTAREAIEKGAHMIVNDLEIAHLKIMQDALPQNLQKNTKFIAGDFIKELELAASSVQGILAARVFHMLDIYQLDKALDLMFFWLKPGGKAFVTTATPYTKAWAKFIPIYETRKQKNINNPGIVEDISLFIGDSRDLPTKMQLFDPDLLEKFFRAKGFRVIKSSYIDRGGSDDLPDTDKKDSCGIIVQKP